MVISQGMKGRPGSYVCRTECADNNMAWTILSTSSGLFHFLRTTPFSNGSNSESSWEYTAVSPS